MTTHSDPEATTIRGDEPEQAGVDLGIPDHDCIRLLGEGGMASVWLCRDKNLKRDVAVKLIKDQIATDPEFLARFKIEAEALARFDHRNIVTVHNYGKSESGQPYILMQYLTGGNLARVIESGELDQIGAAKIAVKLADALSYSHDRGIVHRDVKPMNILMRDSEPVLSDFGVAKSLRGGTFTQVKKVIGAPLYMAPEQESGEPVTGAADVYSFGLVFYQMLTGKLPQSKNRIVHSAEQESAIAGQLKGVDAVYVDLICRCLQADPDKRPTAAECQATIARQLQSGPAASRTSRALVALITLLAVAFAYVALNSANGPLPSITVDPADARIYVDGSFSPNQMLTDETVDQQVIAISPGYIASITVTSADSLSPVSLEKLGLPSAREVLDFENRFFFKAESSSDVKISHYPLTLLIELQALASSNSALFSERMGTIQKLAAFGDQASALVYFLMVEEELWEADGEKALAYLVDAMNSGYALASYYRAIHLYSKHIDQNGQTPVDPTSQTYRDYSGALTMAEQQGLAELAAMIRKRELWLDAQSDPPAQVEP